MVTSDTNSRVKWNRVVRHKKITVTYKCLDFHYGCRDVTTGATGATEVAPKFSDTLTLS